MSVAICNFVFKPGDRVGYRGCKFYCQSISDMPDINNLSHDMPDINNLSHMLQSCDKKCWLTLP